MFFCVHLSIYLFFGVFCVSKTNEHIFICFAGRISPKKEVTNFGERSGSY